MTPSPDPPPTAPASDEALAAPRRGSVGFSWAKFNEGVIPILLVGVIPALMLFFFNETSDRITRLEEDIDDRFAAVDARFTRLEADINARFVGLEADINARFVRLEADIDARFAAVDARFDKLEENQQEIAQTLARLVALVEAGDGGGG